MTTNLSADFQRAAADVKRLPARPGNDTLLKLYALYKQATTGDVSGPKPGFFDFVSTAKYEAWSGLRGMQGAEAQQKYVELVRALQHGPHADDDAADARPPPTGV